MERVNGSNSSRNTAISCPSTYINAGLSSTVAPSGVAEIFQTLRQLIMEYEIGKGKFNKDNLVKIKDFNLDLASRWVQYTNPDSGNEENIDLLAVEDKSIQSALEIVCNKTNTKPASASGIRPHSKGSFGSQPPLNKKFDGALMRLPNNFEGAFRDLLPHKLLQLSSPEQRNIFVRRFLFVEFLYSKLFERIDPMIECRERWQKRPGNDTHKIALQSEIDSLRGLLGSLKKFDFYALSRVLAVYPIGHMWSRDFAQLSLATRRQVESDILQQRTLWDGTLQNKPLSEVQKAYATDIQGMFFIDRGKYFKFCEGCYIEKKSESITDIFLREAIHFANNPQYTGEILKSKLPNVEEVRKVIDHSVALANHVIGHRLEGEYEFAEYPAGITQRDKEKIDQQRKESLRKDILAHRARVNYNLKFEQILEIESDQSCKYSSFGNASSGTPVANLITSKEGSGLSLNLDSSPLQNFNIPQTVQGATHHILMSPASSSPEKSVD